MKKLLLISVLTLSCTVLAAQEDVNVESSIDSAAVVTARIRTAPVDGDMLNGMKIDVKQMEFFPKLLGNSDPLKYAQALPGITTNSELTTGLRVQGCEASHSLTSLCGVPVYGSGHILGLFSVFNPGHFQTMTVSTRSDSYKLGGELDMETADTLARGAHGTATLGMVTAQATVAFQIGKKSAMTVSARRSFIDLFYRNLLSIDGANMNYHFSDYNLSWIYKPDSLNTIDINGYFGADQGGTGYGVQDSYMQADWGNGLGGARWRYRNGKMRSTLQLYGTTNWCNGDMDIAIARGYLQSSIVEGGLNERFEWGLWGFDAKLSYYHLQPQNIQLQAGQPIQVNPVAPQDALLASVGADRRFLVGNWSFKPILGASVYKEFGYEKTWWGLDPELIISYNFHKWGKLTLETGYKHQYLFQTGITNSGFPVEFWFACGHYSAPQSALSASLGYDLDFCEDMFTVALQVYGKRLYNQVEYKGLASDIISGQYSIENELLHGNGINYGASVMFRKNSGAFTGWVSYSFGRALRSFDSPDYPGIYPSSYERLHELNVVASYRLKRWDFGGNFIFSGGLPYTPATALYVIDNSVIVQYGDRNSKRLAPYIRLDLSVSYNIRIKGRFRDSVNFSLQNTTAHKNQLLARLKYKDGYYSYSPAIMVIPVIPSISYHCNF